MSDRLLTALRDLPIDYPGVPEVILEPARAARPRWMPAVAVAAALFVVGAIAPVRDAVADLLGIGVVRVVEVGRLPDDLGSTLDLGSEVPMTEMDLVGPGALGDPNAAFVRVGEQSLVWAPSIRVPEVGGTGVGAILTRFDGVLDPVVEKSLGEGTTLRVVMIDGRRAYWIEGAPHAVASVGPDGETMESTSRLAGNVLLWEADGGTYRFESALPLDAVRRLFE